MPTCRALDKGITGTKWRATCLSALLPAGGPPTEAIDRLTDHVASLATTVQTRMDASTTGTVDLSGGNVELQVQRALAQVLRTATVPVPSLVGGGAGLAPLPSLPPDQAVLSEQATLFIDAVRPLLARLQPIVPNQQATSDVELYRAVLTTEFDAVAKEFARADGPRPALVKVLLGALVGWPQGEGRVRSDTEEFAELLSGSTRVPTAAGEDVTASVGVLVEGAYNLVGTWEKFQRKQSPSDAWVLWTGYSKLTPMPPPALPSVAERFQRASELAPAISNDVASISSALDAIGFGLADRRIVELRLGTLVDADLFVRAVPRHSTVNDILEWAETVARDVPRVLAGAGQLGLNLVADQADELFFLIEAIYGASSFSVSGGDVERRAVEVPELLDAQVRREFLTLARDLDELADLGCKVLGIEGGYER